MDYIGNNLLDSKYYFIWIPGLITFLGFFETVGIFGFFIPIDMISITYFAFIHQSTYLFIFCAIMFFLGIFGGLVFGYFIGRKFYNKILDNYIKDNSTLEKYFQEIDKYMYKYHFFAFPVLINIGFIRPIIGLYLGIRKYNFVKYFLGALLGSLFYVIPRILIGYFVGVFGMIIIKKFKISFKYIIWFILSLVLIALIVDFLRGERRMRKGI